MTIRATCSKGTRFVVAVLLLVSAGLVAQEGQQTDPVVLPPGLTVTVDGVEEPIYKVKDGAKPPRPVYQPAAEFSSQARQAGYSGTVVLALVVTSKGKPTMIRVASGAGMGLDEKAIEAVRQWKFKPATKDGKPVSVQVAVEVSFHS